MQILDRLTEHDFEKIIGPDNSGDFTDESWKIRILAIRDLVALGKDAQTALEKALTHSNRHVRHVSATVMGILRMDRAGDILIGTLQNDPDPIVRGQAAEALGQIRYAKARPILQKAAREDENIDVRHRCELAVGKFDDTIENDRDLAEIWKTLDEKNFRQIKVGEKAPDFELSDTDGKKWRLSDFRDKKTTVLIWIFADWCPVCHKEFHDLIELEEKFTQAETAVFTIECHDTYRCRKMVAGRNLWWPHLVDNAGAVAAAFGTDPMAMMVHKEWVNRPGTVIIDPKGTVLWAYYGTHAHDRPSIKKTLDMINSGSFDFRHPDRREKNISEK